MQLVFSISLILILVCSLFAGDYFQQGVDYKINVTLQPQTKNYSGSERLVYKNNSPDTLHFIWIHLYPNAFKNETTPYAKQRVKFNSRSFYFSPDEERSYIDLKNVRIDSRTVSFQLKEDAIDEAKLILPGPLLPGQSITIDFQFEGKFPKVFSRIGHYQDDYFAGSQWYPKAVVYDRFGWHPDSYLDVGEFYGEFGDYDVSITLPANYAIDATGLLQENHAEQLFINNRIQVADTVLKMKSEKERSKFIKAWKKEQKEKLNYDSLKTVRFKAQNVHDFAWFAGNEYMILQRTHNDSVLTNVLVQPQNVYEWRDAPLFVEQTVSFYGQRVGKYQYPKASVIDGDMAAGGGMEYPMITIISQGTLEWANILELVIMHEVGHNWFYGMLGSNERRDAFLDEGINSFLEYKYMERYHGFNNITNFKKLLKGYDLIGDIGEWHLIQLAYGILVNTGLDEPLNKRPEEYYSAVYFGVTYQKGTALMLALEWLIGEDAFWRGMKAYFERYAGKHPTREDFFAIMEEVSGQDLDWFFNEWYNKATYCDLKIGKTQTQKTASGFETTVFVENSASMQRMPAPVYLVTESGDTIEGRWSGHTDKPVLISNKSPVKRIEVNLRRIIFESNYLNNAAFPKIDLNLIGQFPRFDTYAINILPYYWYEYFKDKNRVGLGFWSGNPLFIQYFAHGSVYYGTGSGNIGYDFNLWNRTRRLLGNYTDLGATIKDMDGLWRVSAKWTSMFTNPSDIRTRVALKAGFDFLRLHDVAYNDPSVFEKTRYSSAFVNLEHSFRRVPYSLTTNLTLEKAIKVLRSKTDLTKLQLDMVYRRFLTGKSDVRLQLFAAGLWGSNIPAQELIYSGGEVDAKHKSFVPGRRGSIAPLRSWTLESGMNMPGYSSRENAYRAGRAAASFSAEYHLSPLPSLYAAVATMGQKWNEAGQDFFAEYGLKYDLQMLKIVWPVYITNPAPGEKYFGWRFYFNYSIPISIGL